jgi:four helix bundle protein
VNGISKKDFVAKMYIALKEANETEYWIELLNATE